MLVVLYIEPWLLSDHFSELALLIVFSATPPLLQSMACNMKALSTATEHALMSSVCKARLASGSSPQKASVRLPTISPSLEISTAQQHNTAQHNTAQHDTAQHSTEKLRFVELFWLIHILSCSVTCDRLYGKKTARPRKHLKEAF